MFAITLNKSFSKKYEGWRQLGAFNSWVWSFWSAAAPTTPLHQCTSCNGWCSCRRRSRITTAGNYKSAAPWQIDATAASLLHNQSGGKGVEGTEALAKPKAIDPPNICNTLWTHILTLLFPTFAAWGAGCSIGIMSSAGAGIYKSLSSAKIKVDAASILKCRGTDVVIQQYRYCGAHPASQWT